MNIQETHMKTTLLTATMLALAISTTSYAKQFYMISSDSNNCKVHWHHKGKNYVYITGSDCTCVTKDQNHLTTEWDIDLDGVTRPIGCYPHKVGQSFINVAHHKGLKKCDPGDHCTQYECMKTFFYDNTEQAVDKVTVNKGECVSKHKKLLAFCDKHGENCSSSA